MECMCTASWRLELYMAVQSCPGYGVVVLGLAKRTHCETTVCSAYLVYCCNVHAHGHCSQASRNRAQDPEAGGMRAPNATSINPHGFPLNGHVAHDGNVSPGNDNSTVESPIQLPYSKLYARFVLIQPVHAHILIIIVSIQFTTSKTIAPCIFSITGLVFDSPYSRIHICKDMPLRRPPFVVAHIRHPMHPIPHDAGDIPPRPARLHSRSRDLCQYAFICAIAVHP